MQHSSLSFDGCWNKHCSFVVSYLLSWNFPVADGTQVCSFIPDLPGPLPLSTISSLTASLSSQVESTTSAFLLFLLKEFPFNKAQHLVTLVPGNTLCVCLSLTMTAGLSGKLFTDSDITGHHWEGSKVKLSFFELCTDTNILNSGRQQRRDSVTSVSSLAQRKLLFTFYFRLAAEMISTVFHQECNFVVYRVWLLFIILLNGWGKITKAYLEVR